MAANNRGGGGPGRGRGGRDDNRRGRGREQEREQFLHFLFLHFESSAAIFAAIIVSLQSSLYAFPSEFQLFCTAHVFCIYIFCTISVSAHELQEAFPAIHPAFSRLHRARTILAGTPTSASKPRRILQDFRRVPPTASVQLHLALHFFGFFRHF